MQSEMKQGNDYSMECVHLCVLPRDKLAASVNSMVWEE